MTPTVLNNDHCLLKLKMPIDILLLIHVVHCLPVTITNQAEMLLDPGTLIFTQGFIFSNFYYLFC